jgi:hypothetical protein
VSSKSIYQAINPHWQVHYEPFQWWAQNGGVFVCADTPHELLAEMAAIAAFVDDWDDDLAYAREAESMMTDGLDA